MAIAPGRKFDRHDSGAELDGSHERPPKLSAAHDLYIDLLGSLVPGLITVLLGGAAVLVTLDALGYIVGLSADEPVTAVTERYLDSLPSVLEKIHWEIATIAVVSAYVVGSILFRQDPKTPDALSALMLWIYTDPEERKRLAAQAEPDIPDPRERERVRQDLLSRRFSPRERLHAYIRPRTYMKSLSLNAEFPYLNLRCYLVARGLRHLAALVPWCPHVDKSSSRRSKMFVNVLKIRLFAFYPNLCRDIVRNEAHVRLATSIWYASGTLSKLGSVLLLIMIAAAIAGAGDPRLPPLYLPAMFVVSVVLFSSFMRAHLRRCVHYMRVREAVYVLEATHVAKHLDRHGIFDDIGRGVRTDLVYCALNPDALTTVPIACTRAAPEPAEAAPGEH